MKCRFTGRILLAFLFFNFLVTHFCYSAEEHTEVIDAGTNNYSDPGKWVLMPEQSLFFAVNGLISNSYMTSEVNHGEPPMSDYINDNNMAAAADYCAERSKIKKGMIFYLLNASNPVPLEIKEFDYEIPPFALSVKFPRSDSEEVDFPLMVISQKPVDNISVLQLVDIADETAKTRLNRELQTFFASNSSFIPITYAQEMAKTLQRQELVEFVKEKMQVSLLHRPLHKDFKDYIFIRGGFEVYENLEYEDEFSGVVFPDGSFKVLPNYQIDTVFITNGRLYIYGIWSYPETGWHDFNIFRVETDNLTKVFSEDACSD